MLYYKEDWEDAQPRLIAWWHREIVDRVALSVFAPRDTTLGQTEPLPKPETLFENWVSTQRKLDVAERRFNGTAYLGEAMPIVTPGYGPGDMALWLGCGAEMDNRTVWFQPIWTDLSTPPALRYDPDNVWWQRTQSLTLESLRRGRGKFLTAQPDIIEGLDVVASLRGTHALLLDLMDYPESVHAVLRQITDLYSRYFDALYDLIAPATPGGGCADLFEVWAPGKVTKVQCDFSAMISPQTFDEFVAPYLEQQCDRLDYAVYHLDGPQAVCHLDTLLSTPSVSAIQWTPGAGQPGVGDPCWYDLYRRILKGGKPVLVLGAEPHEVEPLVRAVGPEGLLITTSVPSESEGRRLLEAAATW